MKRLFCSDFDNTIARKGKILQENVKAVHRLQENGIDFALASGRPAANIRHIFRKYGIHGHIIANNGSLCLPEGGQEPVGFPIPPDEARSLIRLAEGEGIRYLFYSEDICYIPRSWSWLMSSRLASFIVKRRLGMRVKSFSSDNPYFLDEGVYKMNVFVKSHLDQWIEAINEKGTLSATQSGDEKMELMAGGVNKLTGIQTLAKALDVPMDRVITIGDHDNDVEMLMGAGWSFAMSDGSEKAIEAAKMTTDPVDRMGFVKAVDWVIAHPEAGRLMA